MRAVVAVAAALLSLALVAPTSAQFTDVGSVRSGAFTGARLPEPGAITCTQPNPLLRAYVDLSWPAVAGARLRLTLQSSAGVQTLAELPAGTTTYRLQGSSTGTLLALNELVTVRLQTVAGTKWVSATVTTRPLRRTALLGLPVDISCG